MWSATCCRAVLNSHHFGVECPHTAGQCRTDAILVWSATHCRAVLVRHHFVVECPYAAEQCRMDTILMWYGVPHAVGQYQMDAILV